MTIIVEIGMSMILVAAGYIYVCFYLNKEKVNVQKTKVFRLTRNKIVYLIGGICSIACLIILFEKFYTLSLIQNIKLLSLVLVMLPIAAIDFRLQKIPNQLVIAAVAIRGVIYIAEFSSSSTKAFSTLKDNAIGALIIGMFFLLLLLVFKNSIGMGDIKLFAVMGLYQGLWGAVNSVFFSLVVSFVISIVLLITRKKGRKDSISFGPSILLGTIIAIGLTGM